MGTTNEQVVPPRIKAAFAMLNHTRMVTWQVNEAVPMRELTALEKRVEAAALRALQMYFLGEMDFAEGTKEEASGKRVEAVRAEGDFCI